MVISFSDRDRVERYKNITIIPPKKIKEIIKKSQGEFMVPDIIAAWSLISTKSRDIVIGFVVFIIKMKVKTHKAKIIFNKFLFP